MQTSINLFFKPDNRILCFRDAFESDVSCGITYLCEHKSFTLVIMGVSLLPNPPQKIMPAGQIYMEEEPIRYDFWVPVTIRIAWELYLLGISISKELIENAREHILRSIPSDFTIDEAERFAIVYTHDFMDRLNIQSYMRPDIDEDLRMFIPQEWRMRVEKNASSLGRSVFRYHYRDGFSLDETALKLGVSMQKVQRADGPRACVQSPNPWVAVATCRTTDWQHP